MNNNKHKCVIRTVVSILLLNNLTPGCLLGETSENTEETKLPRIMVQASRDPVDLTPPTVKEVFDEEDLEKFSVIDTEDALKFAPNLLVRKRFIGDRNGVLSIRGSSVFQNARSLVFSDGVLLSNLIENRFNGAPRWQIIAPEEIVATEVIYGPYSAAYSGNSMNGVVNFFTRQPNKFESTAQVQGFVQDYSAYGTSDSFEGYRGFASLGDKVGDLSYYGFVQRLRTKSQPQSLVSDSQLSLGNSASFGPVSGVFEDMDPQGRDRYVLGTTGFSEVTQDLAKLKFAYDCNSDDRIQFTAGFWNTANDRNRVDNYLEDPTGDRVWSGNYSFGGKTFEISSSDWRVEERRRQDLLLGLTYEGRKGDLAYQTRLTSFTILEDERRRSNQNPDDPDYDESGRVQNFDDTFWVNFDQRVGYNSILGIDSLDVAGGYQYSVQQYEVLESNTDNFRRGNRDGSLRSDAQGLTHLHALYAQGTWKSTENLTFIPGIRLESWQAKNGSNLDFDYSDRSDTAISPKFAVEYQTDSSWLFRGAVGRAVRFPIITELFAGDPDVRSQVVNNPTLSPERVLATTLSAEKQIPGGMVRLAVFRNEEKDTIFNQRTLLENGNSLTTFLNIDEVVTQGIELGYRQNRIANSNLDVLLNMSFNDTEIIKNRVNPDIEGNEIPRVPQWRINALLAYHFTPELMASLSGRSADSAFGDLANQENNPNTFGGISRYLVADAKVSYTAASGPQISLAVDNLNNQDYFMFHPFPQRTYSIDLTWRF